MKEISMTHPRLLNTRVRIAGAASIATLSLLFTPLSPLYGSVAADNSSETTQAAQASDTGSENATTEEASGASTEETPASAEDSANPEVSSAQETVATADANKPRVRRTRAIAEDGATLAMTVVNNETVLPQRDEQITTINYSCSSVTTPCQGATIEVWMPAPVTPAGLQLNERFYTAVSVTGNTVARKREDVIKGDPSMKRYLFTLKDSIPAGTSDRIQMTWHYDGYDAPNNSVTTQKVVFKATNADSVEQSVTTTWEADTDLAIEKSGPTQPGNYPAAGGDVTYKLRYGYQQIDQTNPNKVGIRWNGSRKKSDQLNGLYFVGVQNIKVVDPLPAKAVFVSASDGGVYDPATHTVTWSFEKWFW